MPRTCSICGHPDRQAIDRALVGGESFRNIAERTGTSTTALFRHRSDHIPTRLAEAKAAEDVAQSDDLLRDARALRGKAVSLLIQAEAAGDYRTALAGIREARGCLELLAKLSGQLDERPQINVLVSPEFQRVQMVILRALEVHPAARVAVADALMALEPAS